MIESSIEELFDSINNSKEYKEYIENLTNKKTNIYLYSIIKDELKELN